MKSPARDLLALPPFSLAQPEKETMLRPRLEALTRHHYGACALYRRVVDGVFGGPERVDFSRIEGIPYLPVSLFKTHELKSVPDAEVVKVIQSSGTTGRQPSRVFVDAETSEVQSIVLVRVAQQFLGTERRPMIVLDHAGVLRDPRAYSARGAGIRGMMAFGHQPYFALREDMSLDVAGLEDYVARAKGQPLLLFGFTWMVWNHFAIELERLGQRLDLTNAMLVHSGGWKKLEERAVTPGEFRDRLRRVAGIPRVISFYGMAEQVGGVYFENDLNFLHAPIFSDVVIRDPVTLAPVPDGEPGLVQVLSVLPTSYPGHSLLTEDVGVIRGTDRADVTLKGRCFEILGRVPRAELRGCSDTFEASVA